MRRSSRRLASEVRTASTGSGAEEPNKRPRRSPRTEDTVVVTKEEEQTDDSNESTSCDIKSKQDTSAVTEAAVKSTSPTKDTTVKPQELEEMPAGPSEYELARLEKIKRNALVMASLGLTAMSGEMRSAVRAEATQKARARGLKAPSKKAGKPKLERTRQSARVRGQTPEGLPMEDPEEAFLRLKQGYKPQQATSSGGWQPTGGRVSGDVSMTSSNASEDGTLRLREMLGGLVGRYGVEGEQDDYELAKPDEALIRLRGMKVEETGVCKVVRERAYSVAWHPTTSKLLLATGDKVSVSSSA